MSTKAQIQAKITALADGGLNTASEVRSLTTDINNELFTSEVTDTQATVLTITKVFANVFYTLTFSKQGNTVHIDGEIEVIQQGYLTIGQLLANFNLGSPFKPKRVIYIEAMRFNSSDRIQLKLSNANNGEISTASVFPTGVKYNINTTYKTND